jgi:hypothetical protein
MKQGFLLFCMMISLLAISCAEAVDCRGGYECRGQTLYVCESETWVQSKVCASGQRCDAEAEGCVAAWCMGDVLRCSANAVQQCRDGDWVVKEQCGEGRFCSNDRCVAEICVEGTAKCELNVLKVCNANQWNEYPCTEKQACNAQKLACEELEPTCSEGEARCEGQQLQLCTIGSWMQISDCKEDTICDAEKRICKPKGCYDGDLLCDNNQLLKCEAGVYNLSKDCGDQYCEKDNCVTKICEDSAVRCNNNDLEICKNNQWSLLYTCPDAEICSNTSKACVSKKCLDNEKRCFNNNVELCENNDWKISKTCTAAQMCANDDCVGVVCNNNEQRCRNNNVEKCTNNTFTNEKSCTSTELCIASGTTASCVTKVCTEGEANCDGQKLSICKNNAWELQKTCTNMEICDSAVKACVAKICNNGETRCDTISQLSTCTNNAYVPKPCTSETVCMKKDNIAGCYEKECTQNGVFCDGNVRKECRNYVVISSQDCGSSNTCTSTACEPNCGNGKLDEGELCDASKLGSNTCASVLGKSDATGTLKCKGTCDGFITTDCKYCGDNKINNSEECDGPMLNRSCVDEFGEGATGVVKCKPNCTNDYSSCVAPCESGSVLCEGNTSRRCIGGTWSIQDCDATQECVPGSGCVERPEVLPTWCSFASIDLNDKIAYGQILLPEGKDVKTAYVACGNVANPVSTWPIKVFAHINNECDKETTCKYNVEYMTTSIDGPAGNYACSFVFNIDRSDLICTPEGGAPIILRPDTTVNIGQTRALLITECEGSVHRCDGQKLQQCQSGLWKELAVCGEGTTPAHCDVSAARCVECRNSDDCNEAHKPLCNVETKSCTTPFSWCNFQYADSAGKLAYGRILPAGGKSENNYKARIVCGALNNNVVDWPISKAGIYNSECQSCGAFNKEFGVTGITSGSSPAGVYRCAFEFSELESTQWYACRLGEHGGEPIPILADTQLSAAETHEYTLSSD